MQFEFANLRRQRALQNHLGARTTSAVSHQTPERVTRGSTFETNGTLLSDSPLKNSTYTHQRPRTVAKMKSALEAELSGGVIEIESQNNEIYPTRDPKKDREISKFIKECELYDNQAKKWTAVSVAEQKVDEVYLYNPLKTMIDRILRSFAPPKGEYRWVKDTHNIRMSHIEGGQLHEETTPDDDKKVALKSSPDISILGNGSHISGSRKKPKTPSYRYCLSPVEIKTKYNFNKKDIITQAGVYARQCFIHQPSRRYVPVVVIVGSILYLYIYDRSGVLRSKAIDIHEDPRSLVRIILGVSTVGGDPRLSPFDPRVRWKPRANHPTVTVTNGDFVVEYKVTGTKFSRKAIRGRGTYCANAVDEAEGQINPVLIKDSWRSSGRPAEYEFFDKIKGLDGVGQILNCDATEPTISTLRRHIITTFGGDDKSPRDRVFSRLVLEAYGRSIRFFTSKLQLLQAFYDAVVGHKLLWKAGILHRDVSVDNILLGREGAAVGNRGVLIDFDMAIEVDRAGPTSQFRTGTRAFQSVAVLKAGLWGEHAPPQDHFDDLESCLYVLAWICMTYDGTEDLRNLDYLYQWEHHEAEIAAGAKRLFLGDPTDHLTAYFNTPVFRKLLIALAKLCDERYREKQEAVLVSKEEAQDKQPQENEEDKAKKDDDSALDKKEETITRLQQIHEETKDGKDHDKFLAIIAKAIAMQKTLDEVRKEEKRIIPENCEYSPAEMNPEFVDPVDTKTPEAGTPPDSPGTSSSDKFVEPAYPTRPRASVTSIYSGTKRSHAESECGGELETGSATKKMKQTAAFSSVPASMSNRRSTRLSVKKSVPEMRR